VSEGQPAKVWFDLDKVHLFDPANGRNLTLETVSREELTLPSKTSSVPDAIPDSAG
jgi:hypothetical protein